MFAPCSTYWYGLLVSRPIRIVDTFCTNALMPSTWFIFGRNSRMTSSADLRSLRGFSVIMIRPMLPEGLKPLVPMKDIAAATFGSRRTMSATWVCNAAMASKEMSSGASVKQNNWPESSLGRKPLGILTNK